MRLKCTAWLIAVTLVLLTVSAPRAATEEDLIVEHNPSSGHFGTIQAAIDSAASRLVANPSAVLVIKVKADTAPYVGSFSPISHVPIVGDSSAGTFLSNGAGTIVNLSGVTSTTIRNFTFRSALIGISVANSSAISISNNVFQLGVTGTAIQVLGAPATSITNNTFFRNGTALSTDSDITITNDIFSSNDTAISAQIALSQLSYNDFFSNRSNGVVNLDAHSIPNSRVPDADPLFLDPKIDGDFHLKPGSPCMGSGNPQYLNSFDRTSSDMGAYGGPNSDPLRVAIVTGLSSSLTVSETSATLNLSWDPTSSSQVTAYRVYSGTSSGNYGPPITVPAGSTSATLSGLSMSAPPLPQVPVLAPITPLDQALQISWTTVSGATGYRVSYGTKEDSLSTSFDVGADVSSVPIPNLTNGTTYFVAVAALAQTRYFAAVTAVLDSNLASNPGSDNESAYSQETGSQGVGPVQVSEISNLRHDFPEAITSFPNLKSEGCFIATAAYGFYSAPQVQALRDFRDRFLLTNAPGRAFVAWYYRYGPAGAHFINVHPWLKPPVRIALFPLVLAALVLKGMSPPAMAAIVLLAAVLSAALLRRKLQLQLRRPALDKYMAALLLLVVVPSLALGEGTRSERPHWSLEFKGGAFFPELANWSRFYGDGYLGEYGAALSYKVLRQLDIGVEGSYLRAKGKGRQTEHDVQAGEVTYELFPLNVFVLARGVFAENQRLVPYAAVGWTRLFYREGIKGQGTTRGSVNGYHARGGVQLLLDDLEPQTSQSLYQEYGVYHTYLFLEGKYLHARADTAPAGSVNAGGNSVLGGFLFEF